MKSNWIFFCASWARNEAAGAGLAWVSIFLVSGFAFAGIRFEGSITGLRFENGTTGAFSVETEDLHFGLGGDARGRVGEEGRIEFCGFT